MPVESLRRRFVVGPPPPWSIAVALTLLFLSTPGLLTLFLPPPPPPPAPPPSPSPSPLPPIIPRSFSLACCAFCSLTALSLSFSTSHRLLSHFQHLNISGTFPCWMSKHAACTHVPHESQATENPSSYVKPHTQSIPSFAFALFVVPLLLLEAEVEVEISGVVVEPEDDSRCTTG